MVMGETQDAESCLLFLEAAARGDLEEIFRCLLTDPGLINSQHPGSGNTALIVATVENRAEVIDLLLDHGADVTLYNANNQSAIHVANDVTRIQLLAAVTRTEFPQLVLAQAAWQGNMEIIQHLLSTEHRQYVNTRNQQGVTPVMLVVRDVDLFEGLAMETEYRPLSVLEELLKHHVNAQILDPNGKSAINYASETGSPLRQQLAAILQKPPPHTETQDGAFCDFCDDTKLPLSDTPLTRPDAGNTHCSVDPGKEPSCGGLQTGGGLEDLEAGAELPLVPYAEGESTSPPVTETADTMYRKKRNSFSQHWLTDPSLEHVPLRSANKRFPSLPPIHIKKDENLSRLQSRGLRYLVEGSGSEPNVSEPHVGSDPLQNIKYIKENIRHRLGSAESSRDSQTYPPLSHSPRLQSVRLRPLSRVTLRNKVEIGITTMALYSENLTKSRPEGQNIHNESDKYKDLVLSKDQVQISLAHFSPEPSYITNDLSSRTVINGFGRGEIGEDIPTETKSTLQGERLTIQDDCKGIMRHPLIESEGKLPGPSNEVQLDKQEDCLLNKINENKTMEDIVGTPEPINEDTKKRTELIKRDISTLNKQGSVPSVNITFSKPEEYKKEREHVLGIRKTNLTSLPHNVSHSFNIHAQKENKKTKKIKQTRSMSASDRATRPQRPLSLSSRTNGKATPLPALVFSSVPLPSKVSKKFSPSQPSSIDRSQRSRTQSSLYTTKRSNSADSTPRAKTSLDFQGLGYTDMFAEIKSEGSGPVISQMFATPVYANTPNTCRDSNSASSRSSSCKTHASSSRDSSARSSKRPKSKNKKSSATRRSRRTSTAKQSLKEDVEKNTEKTVIISGTDWEIETIKQNVAGGGEMNELKDPNQNFSSLSIIKEATIEKSLTRTINAALIEMIKELEKGPNNNVSIKTKLSDHTVPPETITTEGVQQTVCPINSNEQNVDALDDQDPKTGNRIQSPEPLKTEEPSDTVPQSQQAAALATNKHFWREILIESCVNENDLECNYSFAQTPKRVDSYEDSDRLADELISELEKNIAFVDDRSSDVKTLDSLSGKDDQKGNHYAQQDDDDDDGSHGQASSLEELIRNTSLKDSSVNTNYTEKHSDQSYKDSSIVWIKGEVLGKGAYGTVYRGLTSQGELIAAKQVTLHGSDPEVAEKEYMKLQEEVDLLKTLKHVNIVGYLGTCLEDTVVTIFMEFVPGGSISNVLRHFGPLQESVISKYTKHILQGIAYLHKNRVVHRDIKGNNVMLMPSGVIKLIDFGCAKRLTGLSMNGTQWEMLKSMHGTPYWMAPEVICQSGHGEKSDIWSVGCTVFEMATGKPPLAHMPKWSAMFYIGMKDGLMPTLPGHFSKRAREFVDLCLTRDPEQRPSAEQLLQHPFISQKT